MPYKTMNGKLFYRVGDVIISTNSENPSKWYGGTWQLFAPGRTIVCIDNSQTEFNTLKKTGGTKAHTLTVNEMPIHSHSGTTNSAGNHSHRSCWSNDMSDAYTTGGAIVPYRYTINSVYSDRSGWDINTSNNGVHTHPLSINNNGRGYAHNNLQPFIVVYMWTRIA